MQLAMRCIDQLLESLVAGAVSKLWRAKGTIPLTDWHLQTINCSFSHAESSYISGHTDSFLSYLASTTPNSEHKRIRLKTILFLQGSTSYDPSVIRQRLLDGPKFLNLELAIVEGKVSYFISAQHLYT